MKTYTQVNASSEVETGTGTGSRRTLAARRSCWIAGSSVAAAGHGVDLRSLGVGEHPSLGGRRMPRTVQDVNHGKNETHTALLSVGRYY